MRTNNGSMDHKFDIHLDIFLGIVAGVSDDERNGRITLTFGPGQNKMQSETVDFAPVPPPGELDQTTLTSD